MKNLAKAIALTAKLFENKLDKGGQPYILHCLYVGEVDGDECVKCAAVMHDVIEDTAYTIEMLRCLGFSEKTLKILDLLTHEDGVDYMDYIKKLSTNQDAIKIKKRDLEHNSNITRLKGLRKKDFERLEKYHTAYVYLSS
jgi:(p)ppGpp synthase/HD superfamily hydrolase